MISDAGAKALLNNEGYKKMLDVVKKLQVVGHSVSSELDLPSIVVVGDQSSGKSSLLEAISGIRLPSKRGFCKSCPVQLCMKNGAARTCTVKWTPKGGTVAQSKTVNLTSFSAPTEEIPDLISTAMKEVVHGPNVEPSSGNPIIVDSLITVDIISPDVPDLNLPDLPGLVKTPVDLQQATEAMARKYIGGSNLSSILI